MTFWLISDAGGEKTLNSSLVCAAAGLAVKRPMPAAKRTGLMKCLALTVASLEHHDGRYGPGPILPLTIEMKELD